MAASKKGYILDRERIIIQRDLTELDLFVRDFIDVLKKHTGYLVVSGFISICTGRVRGTEDVDILVPVMAETKFREIFEDLAKHGFWCYQGDRPAGVYSYVKQLTSVRFARVNEVFPNVELIPFNEKKRAKFFEFNHPVRICVGGFEFNAPPIEFEILYKEIVLKGKKDMEDAKHLRTFFAGMLKAAKFREYAPIVRWEVR
jgi:hypothetical protein